MFLWWFGNVFVSFCRFYVCTWHLSRLMTKSTKWLCAQWRLRSAWASAQSDQNLRCALSALRTQAFFMRTTKTDQTGLIWVFTGRTCHFVGFVMRRLFLLEFWDWHDDQVIGNELFTWLSTRVVFRGVSWGFYFFPIWAAAWQNQQNIRVPSEDTDQPGQPPSLIIIIIGLGSLATQWAHSEDSDQTGRMPRPIWVFAGHTGHFVGFVFCRLIWYCGLDVDLIVLGPNHGLLC